MAISHHEFIVMAFAIVNVARVFAYLPQIINLIRSEGNANGVSLGTWTLFLVSNITTAAYASIVLSDVWMATIFSGNAIGCLAIVTLVLCKRSGIVETSGLEAREKPGTGVCVQEQP